MADVKPYEIRLTTKALRVLLARTSGPFGSPEIAEVLGDGVRKWTLMVQARAVRNVTGYPVVFSGGVFRVMVRTGTLRASIDTQWPYQSRMQGRVFVNGTHTNPGEKVGEGPARPRPVSDYAAAVENGHKAIDLKKTMQGKVVPFYASLTPKTRGPFTARGLVPLQESNTAVGSKWRSPAHDEKLKARGKKPMVFTKKGGGPAFKGKGSTNYFISYRTVGKTGWIIPAAAPRPFMRAALEGTADQGRLMLVRTVAAALTKDMP